MQIPNNINWADDHDNIPTHNTATTKSVSRKRRYLPLTQDAVHSPGFKLFAGNTILKEVNQLVEYGDYWEGWIRINDGSQFDDLERFLWIYQHQTHTVYNRLMPETRKEQQKEHKINPLTSLHSIFTLDGDITDKYIQRIKTMSYLCSRAKQRGKARPRKTNKATGSTKTDCQCQINVKIFQIMKKEGDQFICDQSQIAVISDNHIRCHEPHDLSWHNRRNAPLPEPLIKKMSEFVTYCPNLKTFKVVMKRYIRDPDGLRSDIKEQYGYYPDLKVKHQINTHTMLDMDRKSSLVKESLPSNIRSSRTLKAISVTVQHGVGVFLMSNRTKQLISPMIIG